MAAHLADILRKHVIVPLNPFIVIDVLAFATPEITAMDHSPAILDFYGNVDVQAFVIHHACDGVFRAVGGIVALADANQVEFLAGHGILADGMKTEPAYPIAPGNAAS